MVGSWSGVSARKTAEVALRQVEGRLTDAIESISEGFSLYDAVDRFVVCNSNYGELLWQGLTPPVPGAPYETIIRTAVERGVAGFEGSEAALRGEALRALEEASPAARSDATEVQEGVRAAIRRWFRREVGRRPPLPPGVLEL